MNWLLLKNSLLVAGSATLLALAFGLATSMCIAGLRLRWQGLLLVAAITAMILPPFLVVDCWLQLFGATGSLRPWIPFDIYSLPGAILILALLNWPLTTILTLAAWRTLDRTLIEADPAVRGWAFIRWLLWPVARPALVIACAVNFVLALNNFAVPALLQVKVIPAMIWVSFSTRLDAGEAFKLSWPLFIAPCLVLAVVKSPIIQWPRRDSPAQPAAFRQQLGPAWSMVGGLGAAIVIGLSVLLPLAQLLGSPSTWNALPSALLAGAQSLGNSFGSAALAATLCVALGALASGWPQARWVMWWPFFIPGVLLSVGLIWLFNRGLWQFFYQSLGLVVLALACRYMGLAVHGLGQARQACDPRLVDLARADGASRWQLWRHAYGPQLLPVAAGAWHVTYLLGLWDVESIVLIVPPGGQTAALSVFNLLHYGHTPQVNALCLLLLVVGAAPMAIWATCRFVRHRWWMAGVLAAGLVVTGCSQQGASISTAKHGLFDGVQLIGTRGTGLGQFNKPRSVAVDRADNLYVVDMTGRVQKFSPQGKFLLSWQMPETDKGKPKGLGVDGAGEIMVLEPHYSRVNHFTTEGKMTAQWGQHGTNRGDLAFPRSIAVNSKGDVFVSEYGLVERVQRFSTRGTNCLSSLGHGGAGPAEFNRPEGLGIDDQDRLYVADSCNHRVQIFGPDGQWLESFGRPGNGLGEMSYPYDVRTDRVGYVFVCEFGNSRIQVFDRAHQPLEALGGPGAELGQLNNPWGVALDSHGNLYVADALNHRVQKYLRRPGTFSSR